MSETNKVMSSLQFPNTQQPYQVNDARIPADPGAYKYMATDGEGNWVAEDRLAWKNAEETELFSGELHAGRPGRFEGIITSTGEKVLFGVEQGEKFLVVWDGTQYECKAFSFSAGDIQHAGFGNPALIPTNIGDITVSEAENNLPFLFASYVIESEEYTVFNLDNKDVHTAQIYRVAETIEKIPLEYLPEGIGYKEGEKVEIAFDSETESISVTRNGVAETIAIDDSRWSGGFYRLFDEPLTDEAIKTMVSGDFAVSQYWDQFVSAGAVNSNYTFVELCISVRMENTNTDGDVFQNIGTYFSLDFLEQNDVTYSTETVHPIPAEYLPQPIVFTTSDLSTVTCNKTADEVVETIATNAQTNVWLTVPSEGVNLHAISNAGNSSEAMFSFLLVNSKAFTVTSIDVTVQNGEFTVATTTLVQPS